MESQDFLTTLIELDPMGRSAEIAGSMIGFAPVEKNNASLIAQMADPALADLIDRYFSNPEVVGTVRRLAFDGASRQTGFILPTQRDAIASGDAMDGRILSQAIWTRMCEGTRVDGAAIAPNDPIWDSRQTAARSNPQAWLDQRDLYGDLADHGVFRSRFDHWLSQIWTDGLEAALRAYLQG